LLNQAATLFSIALENPLDPPSMAALLQKRMPVYDKDREGHYNLISALHKSLRGSDPQAALYWMARMLGGGLLSRMLILCLWDPRVVQDKRFGGGLGASIK